MIATAAAITVVIATTPKAICSRTLMPNFAGFTELTSRMAQPR